MALLIGAPGRRNNTYRWIAIPAGPFIITAPTPSAVKKPSLSSLPQPILASIISASSLARTPECTAVHGLQRDHGCPPTLQPTSSMHSMRRHHHSYRTFSCWCDAYPTVLPAPCGAQDFLSAATRRLSSSFRYPGGMGSKASTLWSLIYRWDF
jgi:hypothetical protein